MNDRIIFMMKTTIRTTAIENTHTHTHTHTHKDHTTTKEGCNDELEKY